MRAVIQRVEEAAVRVGDETLGAIGPGLLILVCAMRGDGDAAAAALARRIVRLRIFRDEAGRMNRALGDVAGAVETALACGKPAVVDVAVDPAALYSFRRDSFKHRGG